MLFSTNNTPYFKAARPSTDTVQMLRRANKIALLTQFVESIRDSLQILP